MTNAGRELAAWYRSHERALLGILSVVGFFALWEIVTLMNVIEARIYGSPTRVVAAAIAETERPRFWSDIRFSSFEFFGGYVMAVVAGIPLGLMMGWYRRLAYIVEPMITFLYAVPRVALLPLIVIWLGLTIWSTIAVAFLGAWVTILLNVYWGVRTVDPRLISVANTFGASDRRLFQSVVLPGSIPFVLAGLRLGVGRALIGVVVGEFYAGTGGLGYMINVASNNLQVNRVVVATLIFIIMGVVAMGSIRLVERRFASWRPAAVV